jgi:hypothetical protein
MSRELVRNVNLTAKQEKFCQNIALHNMTQHDAYLDAYNAENMLPNVVDVKASELMDNGNVKVRMLEIRNMALKPTIATKKRIAERLTHVLESDTTINGTPVFTHIVQSAAELNKMQGNYAKTDIGQAQTIINIIVPDKETKNLLSNVVDNTKVIETGYKVLPETSPDAPE